MRTQATHSLAAWPADLAAPGGVLVLTGYGLDVRVWRGRLRVADGIGRDRREAVVHRATGRLRRLVVLGHTGSISLEAIRWLADVGAAYVQIDADGRVLAAFGPLGTDRPGLRRAQARALDAPLGIDVARRLIGEKIAAQAETLARADVADVTETTAESLREAATRLHVAATRDDVRTAESMAAAAYWSALSPASVRFARRDAEAVPAHWRTLGARTSPLTGSPRLAGNPGNALLNYLYAILEGEATIAARVVGLDPGLGVLHADQPNRDSLAADLMEPVRPLVDRYVLRLLAERPFAAADFYETRQGVCRVTPPLARELASAALDWGRAVGRVAEDVARRLDPGGPGAGLATPISQRNRSRGRGPHGRHAQSSGSRTPTSRCATCGGPVPPGRSTCSAACEAEARAAGLPAFAEAGRRNLERARRSGPHPMTPDGRARVAAAASDSVRRARAWQRTHRWPAAGEYDLTVRPSLERLAPAAPARATGLSRGYCRLIRQGAVVPHPMWWAAIRAAADS